MKFKNAVTFCIFQMASAPLWAIWTLFRPLWMLSKRAVFPDMSYQFNYNLDYTIFRSFMSMGMRFWPVAVAILSVGDTMLTDAKTKKRYGEKHQKLLGMAAALIFFAAWLEEPWAIILWLSGLDGGTLVIEQLAKDMMYWFVFLIIFKDCESTWKSYGVKRHIAESAAQKCFCGVVTFDLGNVLIVALKNEADIRQVLLSNESVLVIWDLGMISLLCAGILPALCKMSSMCFLGDFTNEKANTIACTVLCKVPIASYRRYRVGLMHIIQSCLKFRLAISKFIFIVNSSLAAAPSVVKDFYYSMFHFVLKFRPSFAVGAVREGRRMEKDQCWEIGDSPMSTHYSSPSTKVVKVWKVVCKYSVDWVPYWSRVIYPFSLEYPFDAIRNFQGDGKRRMAGSNHQTRTGYYGVASYFMRIGNLPAFCCTDAAGVAHYRRYIRASALPEFSQLWTNWFLQESETTMVKCVEEYAGVRQVFEQVAKDRSYADVTFPLGIVPMEQFVQFQYIMCAFHERMHMQLYLRQGTKLSTDIHLVLLMLIWVATPRYLGDYICIEAKSVFFKSCRCLLTYWSGTVTLTQVMKAFVLFSIDACETGSTFFNQSNCVHASHRRLVYEWGKVTKSSHVLAFNVTQFTIVKHFSWLLKSFALVKLAGDNLQWDLTSSSICSAMRYVA